MKLTPGQRQVDKKVDKKRQVVLFDLFVVYSYDVSLINAGVPDIRVAIWH